MTIAYLQWVCVSALTVSVRRSGRAAICACFDLRQPWNLLPGIPKGRKCFCRHGASPVTFEQASPGPPCLPSFQHLAAREVAAPPAGAIKGCRLPEAASKQAHRAALSPHPTRLNRAHRPQYHRKTTSEFSCPSKPRPSRTTWGSVDAGTAAVMELGIGEHMEAKIVLEQQLAGLGHMVGKDKQEACPSRSLALLYRRVFDAFDSVAARHPPRVPMKGVLPFPQVQEAHYPELLAKLLKLLCSPESCLSGGSSQDNLAKAPLGPPHPSHSVLCSLLRRMSRYATQQVHLLAQVRRRGNAHA